MSAKQATSETVPEKKQRKRREVNKETLQKAFSDLQKKLEEEIVRCQSEKIPFVRFLRSVNKSVRQLNTDANRVMKLKPKSNRPKNTNSGFMKLIKISPEMLKFTGWDPEKLYSRVEVTRFLCKYVKDHKLQEEKDKRNIIPDSPLAAILRWDQSQQTEKLTYFRLQRQIQHHFIKDPVDVSKKKATKKVEPATKTEQTKTTEPVKTESKNVKKNEKQAMAAAKKNEKTVDSDDE